MRFFSFNSWDLGSPEWYAGCHNRTGEQEVTFYKIFRTTMTKGSIPIDLCHNPDLHEGIDGP